MNAQQVWLLHGNAVSGVSKKTRISGMLRFKKGVRVLADTTTNGRLQ
jgi:hypothetical protein